MGAEKPQNHEGLRQALQTAFPGLIWRRCHTEESLGVHIRRNVIDQTPPPLRDRMHDRLDAILTASAPAPAREALHAAIDALGGDADTAPDILETGFDDATAVLALPPKYRRRLRTTNTVERLPRRLSGSATRARGPHLPDDGRSPPTHWSALRRTTRRAEQHEEGSTGRRSLTMDAFFAWERAQAEHAEAEHAEAEHAEAEPDPTATPLPHAAQSDDPGRTRLHNIRDLILLPES